MGLYGRRVEDPINAYIDRTVAHAHPDADQIRAAERNADTTYHHAEHARRELDAIVYADLRPHRRAAHTPDPTGRLAAVADELAAVERDLRTVSTRVEALNSEPSIRTLPSGELDGEHQRWAADRVARQESASREAQQRWQSRQERRRIEPPSPSRSTPGHGWGFGR
jgi:hypothetical protein